MIARLRRAGCVFAEDEAELLADAATSLSELDGLVARRVEGVPLEHVIGWAEFCGLRILVEPCVFVPRVRTELMVREAARLARPGAVVVDLCCGSGAVGAALAATVGRIELHAADIEPAAVRCARRNVQAVGGTVYEGDLFEALPVDLRGCIDVLVANVPYVPTADLALMPPEARLHEPRTALDGGGDGLDVQRRVAATASTWLAPGGHVLVETSGRQTPASLEIFMRNGLRPRPVHDEESDATVVIGSRAGSRPGVWLGAWSRARRRLRRAARDA